MKKILAIGDSFTYGEELDNLENAWPYILGKKLGCQIINKGIPGSSNYKMLRCIVESDIRDIDLVIIAWSHFDRVEVSDEAGIYEIWPGGERKGPRKEAHWRGTIIDYFSRHHDDDYLYRQYLTYIILSQAYLQFQDKKYIMLDSFGNHLDARRHHPNNQNLIKKIDTTYFLGWPNESMLEWTIHSLTPVPAGPGGHFLDEGHLIVADKIYKFITKNKFVK